MWDYLWDLNKNRRHMCVWNVRVVIVGGKKERKKKKKLAKIFPRQGPRLNVVFFFPPRFTQTHTRLVNRPKEKVD